MKDRGAVLVTGGSRGIGASVALKAAEAGYDVAITYLGEAARAREVVDAVRKLGRKAEAFQGDIGKISDVARLFSEFDGSFERLAVLVNNAGVTGRSSPLAEAAIETVTETIAVNLTGAILAAREAVKRMSTRRGGKGGVIVNISSGASTIGSPGEYTWYAATKGAIDSFTLGLGREVAEEGIRVVAVAPGLTETELHARSTGEPGRVARMSPVIPMKRAGTADEVADAVLYLMGDQASYITATTLRVTGGR